MHGALPERANILDYRACANARGRHGNTNRHTVTVEGSSTQHANDAHSEPPPGDYDFRCLPLRLAGLDGAPARALLIG